MDHANPVACLVIAVFSDSIQCCSELQEDSGVDLGRLAPHLQGLPWPDQVCPFHWEQKRPTPGMLNANTHASRPVSDRVDDHQILTTQRMNGDRNSYGVTLDRTTCIAMPRSMRSSACDQSILGKKKRRFEKLGPKARPREACVFDGLDRICLRDRSCLRHFHQEGQRASADSR